MPTASLVLALAVGGCGPGAVEESVPRNGPPNVLLISLDALRADALGSYGCARDTSPFLDDLAARGTRFANAYANTHGTPPSHATMLTSLYQETHLVGCPVARETPRNDVLPDGLILFHELLRDSGYLTIGVTDGGYMSRSFGFDRGFDLFWDHGTGIASGTGQVIRYLEDAWDGHQPVFVFLHTYEIHSPYEPPDEYREVFGPLPAEVDASNDFLMPIQDTALHHLVGDDFTALRQLYDAGVRYADDILSDFFLQLEAKGFLDNALVIITSDHGEEFGDHGGLLHRATLYEELLRVPLILYGTGVPKGTVVDRFVGLVDLAPTILGSAGQEVPEMMAGQNLLNGQPEPEAEAVVFAQYGDYKYSIRENDWKLVVSPRWNGIELYNLARDPGEQTDLSGSNPLVVARLRGRIDAWRSSQPSLDLAARRQPALTDKQRQRLEALGYVD